MNIRLLALLPFAVACGPKDAPIESAADSDAAPAALTGADITGRWASGGCEAYDDGQGGKSYLTRDFTLTAETWALDLGLFGDEACSYALFTVQITGPYTLGGLSQTVAGATEGDFTFGSIVWTAKDQGLADTFTGAGCGAAAVGGGRAPRRERHGLHRRGAPHRRVPDGSRRGRPRRRPALLRRAGHEHV
jgi:hypothetical protein